MNTSKNTLDNWNTGTLHFVGMAGVGMSAIARFLNQGQKSVSGSDRQFGSDSKVAQEFEEWGMKCFAQDGSGVTPETFGLCVSTAVEEGNPDLEAAKAAGIPIWHRSEVLAYIASQHKTIAVSGTSGKSSVTAMIYHILDRLDMNPSVITGAPITELGPQGNAHKGSGDWLVLEADESDGTLVNYHSEVGLLLNVDRDHKELSELEKIFTIFRSQSKHFVVWADQERCNKFSVNQTADFGEDKNCGFWASDYQQKGWNSHFNYKGTEVVVPLPGVHTMWNALSAIASTKYAGIDPLKALESLKDFKGVWRRHIKLIATPKCLLVDDFAHNPAKIEAAIKTCQSVMPKVVSWFQPHGFGPTKFMKDELLERLSKTLRPEDEFWIAPIYFAGGTVNRDISAEDLVNEAKSLGINAKEVSKENMLESLSQNLSKEQAILLMGARDPKLEEFSHTIRDGLLKVL
jgi:UDP-N-acetylmuramate--alanine ligase